jgi:uncharacterized protein YaaN involved in tellurite resistance
MEEKYLQEEIEDQSQPDGVDEALDHMKQTLHDMKLQDAIHRQEIRKLERDNDKMETKIQELTSNISGLEKQKLTDEQYLMKQQEVITKSEMAEEIDQNLGPSKSGKPHNIGKFI